jgi:putative endonuclease
MWKECQVMNYTYLLQCADGSLYCGWTNCLWERVKVHNEGRGAKYTRGRRPVELVYFEEFATKQEAMQREAAIKRLTRQEKEKLVESRGMKAVSQETANDMD